MLRYDKQNLSSQKKIDFSIPITRISEKNKKDIEQRVPDICRGERIINECHYVHPISLVCLID
jgi:hypothetical protein